MNKYKVLRTFRDIRTKELYKKDSVIELSEERAAEIHENLKEKGVFIELVPAKEENEQFDREAAKEKLTELGVEFKGNASNETLQKLLDENKEVEEEGK